MSALGQEAGCPWLHVCACVYRLWLCCVTAHLSPLRQFQRSFSPLVQQLVFGFINDPWCWVIPRLRQALGCVTTVFVFFKHSSNGGCGLLIPQALQFAI